MDAENRSPVHRQADPDGARPVDPVAAPPTPVAQPLAVLGHPNIRGRGNGLVLAATLLQAQRQFGNRAVQRFGNFMPMWDPRFPPNLGLRAAPLPPNPYGPGPDMTIPPNPYGPSPQQQQWTPPPNPYGPSPQPDMTIPPNPYGPGPDMTIPPNPYGSNDYGDPSTGDYDDDEMMG